MTLPRPLGIVFEYDERQKQAYVVDLVGPNFLHGVGGRAHGWVLLPSTKRAETS